MHTTFLGGGFGRRLESDFIPAAVGVREGGQQTGETAVDARRRHDSRQVSAAARSTRSPATFDANRQAERGEDAPGRAVDHLALVPGGRRRTVRSIRSPWKRPHNFPYDVPNVLRRLSAARDRHRRRLLALGEPRAQLLRRREFHGRAGVRGRSRSVRVPPRTARQAGALADGARYGREEGGLGTRAERPLPRHRGRCRATTPTWRRSRKSRCRESKLKVHRIVCAIDCGQLVNPDIVDGAGRRQHRVRAHRPRC